MKSVLPRVNHIVKEESESVELTGHLGPQILHPARRLWTSGLDTYYSYLVIYPIQLKYGCFLYVLLDLLVPYS